jgi:hypothetical protein
MPRLTPVFVTVLALAVLAQSSATAEEPPTRRPVVVTATCPNNPNGPLNVTVNPWLLELDQGNNARWNLNINNSSKNRIVVEAKPSSGWPYPDRKHEGDGHADADNMKPEAQGDYTYTITIYCNADTVVIDPRVRVGP